MANAFPPAQILTTLIALRDRAMAAETLNALAFSMANDLYSLLPFRQALVFSHTGRHPELLCISGLAKPAEDSPYLVWLKQASRWVADQFADTTPKAGQTTATIWIDREKTDPPPDIAEGWSEWWAAGLLVVSFHRPNGERLGFIIFQLETGVPEGLLEQLGGVFRTWGYCWHQLSGGTKKRRWRPSRRAAIIIAIVAAALLFIPVRQSALAPAEIVSRDTQIISAPLNGVIDVIAVRPNQQVTKGDLLFTLDQTTLRNKADVLIQEVAVAEAELQAASQGAFNNPQSKGELTVLSGRVQQRRAELAAVLAQLDRTRIEAPADGVVVFTDPNDWIGKPVATGERILQLANPDQPAMRIELSVADAITLEVGADVTLFLTAYPLEPVRGKILETSYQARPHNDGIVSYRLLANIENRPEHVRLGLHGTAKLYGDRVPLGYYLLRRPLATARAWSGL
ncbi:efflux RND transporter periplasmic adaptor subunit [Thalassospira xianhensis]|uniref:Multidrug transporter n=1 Tax=Thalassospira xianhensis MCCC 1A02616 TaxID=1177929 RepID=A0A367UGY8_9PROT|nr:HlyD family efflux transporter periplasmic adaptor subunit [Thalassospira xianhensis]RCK07478.1 multidrug transporter [Thalassospira xianhensis MCCC 1A02616]